jgi:hypothetical protein
LNPIQAGLTHLSDKLQASIYLDWIGNRGGILMDSSFMIDNINNIINYQEKVEKNDRKI